MVAHDSDGAVVAVGAAHINVLLGGPQDQDLYACATYAIAVGAPHGIIDTIKKSIDVAKSCLKLGQFAFAPIAPILGALAEVGTLVQSILAFIPTDKPDPYAEIRGELKVLGLEIEQLSKAMTAKFNDLKEFLIELNFYREVIVPTANMTSYMQDCLKHPNEQSMENFKNAYSKHSPLSLAKTVQSLLDYDTTNPLKIAMSNDTLKTKNTFNKWFYIIDGLLGQLLFLEAFSSGLLHKKSPYNPNALNATAQEIFKNIDQWKEEYKKSSAYWPAVKEFAERCLNENHNKSNNDQAEAIKKTLETILTYDSFYIMVTNHYKSDSWRFQYYVHNKEQLHELFGPGNGNCLIYRSRKANLVDQEKLTRLRRDVKRTFIQNDMGWADQLNPKVLFKGYDTPEWMAPGWFEVGFVGAFHELDEALLGANCDQNSGEPGWWSKVKSLPNYGTTNRHLVVGYL